MRFIDHRRGHVTGSVNIIDAFHAQHLVDGDAPQPVASDRQKLGERARPHAGAPDDRSGWDPLTILQHDGVGLDGRHRDPCRSSIPSAISARSIRGRASSPMSEPT